tara:strand:+ start:1353 stop:1481 length:129 start_codon:yes stop_codon:yes gene_type:complete
MQELAASACHIAPEAAGNKKIYKSSNQPVKNYIIYYFVIFDD